MRIEKEYIVEELKNRYAASNLMVVTTYHGLGAENMNELRGKVSEANGTINIVPNRLLKRALPDGADPAFSDILQGPNAIAATEEDIVELSKALKAFADDNKTFEIRGGLLELKTYLNQADIISLASLPPKEILQAQLAGALQGPIRKLAVLFNTLLGNTVRVLDQVAKLKEEGGGAVEPAEAPAEETAEAPAKEAAEAPAEEAAEAPAEEAAEAPAEEAAEAPAEETAEAPAEEAEAEKTEE
jgi:large subunit ribosomal protein L10